jgi:hypothetical protein
MAHREGVSLVFVQGSPGPPLTGLWLLVTLYSSVSPAARRDQLSNCRKYFSTGIVSSDYWSRFQQGGDAAEVAMNRLIDVHAFARRAGEIIARAARALLPKRVKR